MSSSGDNLRRAVERLRALNIDFEALAAESRARREARMAPGEAEGRRRELYRVDSTFDPETNVWCRMARGLGLGGP